MKRPTTLSPNQQRLLDAFMKATWRGSSSREPIRTGPRARRPRWRPGMNLRGPAQRTGPLRYYTAGRWRAYALLYCCDLHHGHNGWFAWLQTTHHGRHQHPGPYVNVRCDKSYRTKRAALAYVVCEMINDERERPTILRKLIRKKRARLRELEAELAKLVSD